MVTKLLSSIGFFLARSPESVARLLCAVLGAVLYYGRKSKRRIIHSNLHHAFPDMPRAERKALARKHCRRLIELGCLAFSIPHFSNERLRRHFRLHASVGNGPGQVFSGETATVLVTPHSTLTEPLTILPLLLQPFPEIGVIFRPLDHPGVDAWVKKTRERHGMKLLSKREGFQQAMGFLRRKGVAAILFDQNAGEKGALITFFDRLISATELPGLLAAKHEARVFVQYSVRTGFWRAEFRAEKLIDHGSGGEVTLAANRWLEKKLKNEPDFRPNWFWIHNRWRCQDQPEQRLRIEAKRNLLSLQHGGEDHLPRKTRFWIRMPNWLGDVVMALPLVRALRASRPDAAITLLAAKRMIPFLESLRIAESCLPLPPKSPLTFFRHFRSLRHEYPDTWILFTNSFRGDLEAWLADCPQRFGMLRPGKRRPLLTDAWSCPPEMDGLETHQVRQWEAFLRHFGLRGNIDFKPFSGECPVTQGTGRPKIGLICGTENHPAKRWPVDHWRRLIREVSTLSVRPQFVLFGTERDRAVTTRVAGGFPPEEITDLAGSTTVPEFVQHLRSCSLVIANDTGGLHLANALGVPTAGLYGPTNPLRTGPVFESTSVILQPDGCPPSGGAALSDLKPAKVIQSVREMLSAKRSETTTGEMTRRAES